MIRIHNLVRIGFFLILITPPITIALLVRSYGVNVPYADQWEFVYIIEKYDRGMLNLGDLWSQHLDHRIFFPRIIWLSFANASRWNLKLELYLDVALAVCVSTLLLMLLKRTTDGVAPRLFPFFAIFFSCLAFSPIQWENWLWGFALQWFLNVLGAVGAISALALWPRGRSRLEGVLVGVACAALGTYSMSHGVFIWIACIPIFVFRRHLRRYLPLWMLSGLGAIGLFAFGYAIPSYHAPLGTFLDKPLEFGRYVLIYLGGSLGSSPEASAIIGFILVVAFSGSTLFILVKRSEKLEAGSAWIALSLYAILSALITAVGRVEYGAFQATESRYTTVATLFLLSTATLAMVAFSSRANLSLGKISAIGFVLGGIVVLILFVFTYRKGLTAMRQRRDLLIETRACFIQATSKDDPCLTLSFPPSGEIAWDRSRYLMRKGWGGLPRDAGSPSHSVVLKNASVSAKPTGDPIS